MSNRKLIYKYELNPEKPVQKVKLHKEHKILSVIEQIGKIQMYAIVNIDSEPKDVDIYINPTGVQLEDDILTHFDFIGTVSLFNGIFVAHIFKDKSVQDLIKEKTTFF